VLSVVLVVERLGVEVKLMVGLWLVKLPVMFMMVTRVVGSLPVIS